MAAEKRSVRKDSSKGKKDSSDRKEMKKKRRNKETPEEQNRRENKQAEIREMQSRRDAKKRMKDTIWGIVFVALGIFVFFAVQFHQTGEFGNVLGHVLRGVFGIIGLAFPWYLIFIGFFLIMHKTLHVSKRLVFFSFLLLLMICILNSARFINPSRLVWDFTDFYNKGTALKGGGLFGMTLGMLLIRFFGAAGLYLICIVVSLICILLLFNSPISRAMAEAADRREEKRLIREMKKEEARKKADEDAFFDEDELPPPEKFSGKSSEKEGGEDGSDPEDDVPFWVTQDAFEAEKDNLPSSAEVSDVSSETFAGADKGQSLSSQREQEENESVRVISAYGDSPHSVPDFREYALGFSANEDTGTSKNQQERENIASSAVQPYTLDSVKQRDPVSAVSKGLAGLTSRLAGRKYKKPPVTLLKEPTNDTGGDISSELKEKARRLEDTLSSFHVDAKVVQVTQGPAVTRYELEPAPGVKVNSIKSLSNDIALNLRAKSIRMEAPIPGKAAVGIEVENDRRIMVSLREIIDSDAFRKAKSKLSFAVGKDITGKSIVADLTGMPHLLIAGSTGSGKSVCINSILTSFLYKADPDEVKLLLIDPKVVELGIYNGIPHLLIPVVTEPGKAAAALNWAVAEMTSRYKTFAENNVRDLESYNRKIINGGGEKLPQIVIVIDELADLMMAAPRQVEESIARLAQMARAAGMHLIVATQRPSVDIVTGVIKANIPSRIAFTVSSQADSRTILDMGGAEKLVGKGDMLFNPIGSSKPTRVQGTFVSDEEVNDVIEFVKNQTGDVNYAEDVIDSIDKDEFRIDEDEDADELLPEAIECVMDSGQASTSMLQRRFRIGYNRAARIMDMLEDRGIVGPQDGSRPRQVLKSKEEYEAEKEGTQRQENQA